MAFWTAGFELADQSFYEGMGWNFAGTSTLTNTSGEFHASPDGRGGSWGLFVEDGVQAPAIGVGGRWVNFWFKNGVNFAALIFRRLDSDTLAVRFDPSGNITIRRGGGSSTILADGFMAAPRTPHWISVEADAQNSGSCSVYVDGVLTVTYSGDTTATGEDGWDQIEFGGSANAQYYVDDVIITTVSEGRLDESYIPLLLPDGNDVINSEATSTGGAGSYTNVDEVPPDDNTSYNEFTVANTDRYTTANLGYTPASVHSVTILTRALREGTLTNAETVCATDTGGGGATEAYGAITGIASAGQYSSWQDTFNVDPDTATSWTATGLDDLRIGIRFS